MAAIPARAGILDSARTLVGCVDPIEFVQDPMHCTLDLNGNVASASVTLLPLPSVLVTTVSPVGSGNSARANAGATYYFQLVGGNDGDIVPIVIGATLEAHSRAPDNPRGYAQASLVTFTSADGLATGSRVCTYAAICQSLNTSFSGTVRRNATSGAAGEFVNLTAEAYAAGTGAQFDEFASAFVDPFIYIDPAFPDASLYSIVVSPGVGNGPLAAVPEPATLWLVAMALGTLLLSPGRPGWRLRNGGAETAAGRD
jgi:hypothetical protein